MSNTTPSSPPEPEFVNAEAPGSVDGADDASIEPAKPLSAAAKRALAEAAERREAAKEAEAKRRKEIGGRGGPDPVRYGDWEKGGICWDF